MKVLVTGGAGFIGSNIVKALENDGIDVIVLDDFSHSSYKNLADAKAEIVCGSILDENIFVKIPKVEAVIHEAAITDTTLDDDAKMMAVNYQGSQNVLDFCLKRKIRLVYASSAGVYGESAAAMREDQKITPHNVYAYSKYLFDCTVMRQFKAKTYPIVGLRYFNVYGPGEYHKGTAASMIYQLYSQMKQKRRPRIFKFGEQKRDFIYVKDAARLSVAALRAKQSAILNVGTGQARSFNDIIRVLNQVLKKDLEPEYFDNPYMGKYQNYTEADTTRLKTFLKTGADFSLEDGIRDYVENYLQSGEKKT